MIIKSDSGQTLVASSLALSVFMLLVLAIIDFGYLFSSKLTLQNAVRQGGRYATTGQCVGGGNGACSLSRYNSILQTVETAALGIVPANEITITCADNGGGCPNSAGGPGDSVTITVTHRYYFMTNPIAALFPARSYAITVSAAFTNEAFPPSAS